MASEYLVAGAILLLSIGLAAVAIFGGRLLAPPLGRKENPPPEHGGRTGHKTWVQFRVRYAIFALIFVAFDMEMVYMFPWSVVYRRLGLTALLDAFVFIAILSAALIYAWKEGAFDWED